MSSRYIVQTVAGFTITPGVAGGTGNTRRPPTRSFTVLDSAVCYRIMSEFISGASTGTEHANERLARELCDKLNAAEDEYTHAITCDMGEDCTCSSWWDA